MSNEIKEKTLTQKVSSLKLAGLELLDRTHVDLSPLENQLKNFLSDERELKKILVDYKIELPEDEIKLLNIAKLALHCILNGPVGILKATKFPFGGEGNIKDMSGIQNLTSKKWTILCRHLAFSLKKADIIVPCQTIAANGDYWPLAEWVPKQKK